jgi:hypothetical protein
VVKVTRGEKDSRAAYARAHHKIVRDKRIFSAYVNEFAQVAAMSEPPEWETSWANLRQAALQEGVEQAADRT